MQSIAELLKEQAQNCERLAATLAQSDAEYEYLMDRANWFWVQYEAAKCE
jgi:hypothetical protein